MTEDIQRKVRNIVEALSIKGFDIGRSGDLEDRRKKGGYDDIIPVTGRLSCKKAGAIEGHVRTAFCSHPKFRGHACDARGGCPTNKLQQVYVAIYKNKKQT